MQSDVVSKYKAAAKIANSEFWLRAHIPACAQWQLIADDMYSAQVVAASPALRMHVAGALASAVSECQPGAKIVDICTKTDKLIEE